LISVVIPVRTGAATETATAAATVSDALAGPADEIVLAVSREDRSARMVEASAEANGRVRAVVLEGRRSVPQLRLAGLLESRGDVVAFTEDHCRLAPGWPEPLAEALQDEQVGVAGGPVPNRRNGSMVDRAIYASRYAAFAPPVAAGDAVALPGTSIAYRRETLDQFLGAEESGLWEHELNLRITAAGLRQVMVPEAWASHGKPYRLGAYCALRMRHGRCYAGRRRDEGASVTQALRAPLLPGLLTARTLRQSAGKVAWSDLAFEAPVLGMIHSAWALGELIGYLRGSGPSCSETD